MLTFQTSAIPRNVERGCASATRSFGDRRPAEGRFRPPRVLRIAIAVTPPRFAALPQRPSHRSADANDRKNSRFTSPLAKPLSQSSTTFRSRTIDAAAMSLNLGSVDSARPRSRRRRASGPARNRPHRAQSRVDPKSEVCRRRTPRGAGAVLNYGKCRGCHSGTRPSASAREPNHSVVFAVDRFRSRHPARGRETRCRLVRSH